MSTEPGTIEIDSRYSSIQHIVHDELGVSKGRHKMGTEPETWNKTKQTDLNFCHDTNLKMIPFSCVIITSKKNLSTLLNLRVTWAVWNADIQAPLERRNFTFTYKIMLTLHGKRNNCRNYTSYLLIWSQPSGSVTEVSTFKRTQWSGCFKHLVWGWKQTQFLKRVLLCVL
jgi:hypothetical protein